MKVVITYGTFDILHPGHLRLLQRARSLGDRLIVGVSSDVFNKTKGKRSVFSFEERAEMVAALKVVDDVFAEESWEQKSSDIVKYGARVFAIGDDWKGKFDHLSGLVDVVYLPRTPAVSTTEVKRIIASGGIRRLECADEVLEVISKGLS